MGKSKGKTATKRKRTITESNDSDTDGGKVNKLMRSGDAVTPPSLPMETRNKQRSKLGNYAPTEPNLGSDNVAPDAIPSTSGVRGVKSPKKRKTRSTKMSKTAKSLTKQNLDQDHVEQRQVDSSDDEVHLKTQQQYVTDNTLDEEGTLNQIDNNNGDGVDVSVRASEDDLSGPESTGESESESSSESGEASDTDEDQEGKARKKESDHYNKLKSDPVVRRLLNELLDEREAQKERSRSPYRRSRSSRHRSRRRNRSRSRSRRRSRSRSRGDRRYHRRSRSASRDRRHKSKSKSKSKAPEAFRSGNKQSRLIKSPSDTTLYRPALKKVAESDNLLSKNFQFCRKHQE